MRLGVEYPFVQRKNRRVRKKEEQILKSLSQKEAFHLVPLGGLEVQNRRKRRVSIGNLSILLESLKDFPSPFAIFIVPGDAVQNKEAKGKNKIRETFGNNKGPEKQTFQRFQV